VAIKLINKEHNVEELLQQIDHLINEIKVHWALEYCMNILQLIEIYEDDHFLYLVLEYQIEGTLLNIINDQLVMSENEAKGILE
jgi:serine/threonine protein kinase